MNTLIGSRALAFWKPDLKLNHSTDWDVISQDPITGCEHHQLHFLNNNELVNYSTDCIIKLPDGSSANVMSMMGLSLIKRSHLWRDLSFDKHITQYHKYGLCDVLKHASKTELEVLSARTNLTKQAYPQGNPSLMKTVKDFFDDAVDKKYDHDYLHQLVSFFNKPIYTLLQENQKIAWCEIDKWNVLDFDKKVKCVAEETYVIAIERMMVPKEWNYPSKLAYMKALKKVCTTLTSGWFRDFAIDHYPEILLEYNHSKFESVKQILRSQV